MRYWINQIFYKETRYRDITTLPISHNISHNYQDVYIRLRCCEPGSVTSSKKNAKYILASPPWRNEFCDNFITCL